MSCQFDSLGSSRLAFVSCKTDDELSAFMFSRTIVLRYIGAQHSDSRNQSCAISKDSDELQHKVTAMSSDPIEMFDEISAV